MTKATRATVGLIIASSAFALGADDKPLRAWVDVPFPRRLSAPMVPYPQIAVEARAQCILVIRVLVGPDGRPKDLRVEEGVPLFDEVALQTLRSWQYEPTVVDDKARRVILYEPLLFTLGDGVAEQITKWVANLKPKSPWSPDAKLWAIPILQHRLRSSEAEAATKGLERLATDSEPRVAEAAKAALAAGLSSK